MKKKHAVKTICFLLVLAMLCGCGKKKDETAPSDYMEGQNAVSEPDEKETVKEEPKEEPKEAIVEEVEIVDEKDEPAEPDYEAVYEPVLKEVWEIIVNGYDSDREYDYASTGLIERVMYAEDSDLLYEIGYEMTDISGDGVPELIIGFDDDIQYDDLDEQSYILSVFSISNDEPFCVIEGWARNSYRWLGDGHFFNLGSGGAMVTIFGEAHLKENGSGLIWDDYYFSDEGEDGNTAFYHNTTGEFDAGQSERVRLSDEAFWNMIEDYEAKCGLLKWTMMADFGDSSQDGSGQKEAKDDKAMELFMDYFRDPTAKNWNTFMKAAPEDAVLFIITNPVDDMKDLVSDTVVIDEETSDILVAVALSNYTQLDLESGEMVFNDRGAMQWNPDPDGKLYSDQLDQGFFTCFRMTIPEGGPARCLNIKTEGAAGMFPVTTLSGEWNQQSTFVRAFEE